MTENKMIQTPNDRESLEYLVNLGREQLVDDPSFVVIA